MSWENPYIGKEVVVDGKTWVYVGDGVYERKDISIEDVQIVLISTTSLFFYKNNQGGYAEPIEITLKANIYNIDVDTIVWEIDETTVGTLETLTIDTDDADTYGFPDTVKVTVTDTDSNTYIDEILIGVVEAGVIGPTGDEGVGIASIVLLATDGKKKTYRITLTDASTFDYDVWDGDVGVTEIINFTTDVTLTIDNTHIGAHLRIDNVDSVTVTLPLHSTDPLPVGSIVTMIQGGIGQVIIEGETDIIEGETVGVTLNAFHVGAGELPATAGQFAGLQIIKVGENEWDVIGHIEIDE